MPETPEKTYAATLRYAPMSAQKIRAYADLIRGKFADEAVEILSCYPARGARFLEQTLKSALANAEEQRATGISNCEVVEVRIDGGPMQRRFRPKSRGSSSIYLKRSSHITVKVG
jgi:large subunit ribosomal protein L22